jgi:hypothetical protein
MIIIFDTNSGLCNQFYDICNGINFCLKYNIHFTFRYCAFRRDTLTNWFQTDFEKLFDKNFLNNYELYINYNDIIDKITNNNCYNFNDKILSFNVFNDNNILDQLIKLNKDYIVLYQFWSLYKFKNFIDNTIHTRIFPSNDIMKKYIEIKNNIIGDEPYNFIHYRHEKDFTDHFKVKIERLDILIDNIKFKNNNFKIFIATSNIKNLIDLHNCKYKNLIYKNDDMLLDLNFEQRAFIDYMFGLNSVECFGHSKSSFSVMINDIKQTKNYYA